MSGPTFETRPKDSPPRASNRSVQEWRQCESCARWFACQPCLPTRLCSRGCAADRARELGLHREARNGNWKGGVSNDNMRYRKRAKEQHPVEEAARAAVKEAVRSGRLIRQPCKQCEATPAQAHHPDYSKPLDVEWLCRSCHDREHRSRRVPRGEVLGKRTGARRLPNGFIRAQLGGAQAEGRTRTVLPTSPSS